MCGIAGYSGTFEPELLGRMGAAIAHRGPDDDGTFADREAGIGLAHRRLSIIDVSPLGHQPMSDPSERVTLVFNGEIYNFRELRRELEAKGVRFKSHSDTEVLVHLYLDRGAAFLEALNGIFALALWDRERQTLLLARDGLGVIPLYIGTTRRGLLFASEIKALIQADDLDRTIDRAAAASYLSLLWCPAPRTALAAVKKLEPGWAMEVRRGEVVRRWRFYELPYGIPRRTVSASAAAGFVREVIRSAVHRQMVSDVPVGAFLSGGLDSSAVVAFAREQSPQLPCFTIAFNEGSSAEEGFAEDLPFAERVARHLGVELEIVRVGSEMADELPRMVWQLDEPQADLAPLNALFIAERARSRGIKVLLSGAGGDDIFTGYRRHLALTGERMFSWLPNSARVRLASSFARLPTGSPLLRRAKRAMSAAPGNDAERIVRQFQWLSAERTLELLSPDSREAARRELGRDGPLFETLRAAPPGSTRLDRMLYLEAKHFLADHNLPYTNKMGMAAGVEVRVPLLDREVVAAAAALPDGFKQHGLTGKWIFKKAMEPILPRDVIYRPKTGFGVPLRGWLRGPLAPLVDELLSERTVTARNLFDAGAVRSLVERDRAGIEDAAGTLLSMMCFELWARQFVDLKPA